VYPFTNCIYILCSQEDENGVVEPIATAFAVNGKIALTAGHTVAKQGNDGFELLYSRLVLTKQLESVDNQVVPEGELITVEVKKADVKQDWAVLERRDNKLFKEAVPVATMDEDLPTRGTMNKLTFYHCPVTLFVTQGESILHVTPKEGSLGLIGTKQIQFQNGGFDGSCGGPYVYRGKAVAIHVESVNSALTSEALMAHRRHTGKRTNDRMLVNDAIELADSSASSHTSNASGIIIRAYPELMEYINGST
jgi:hypothetical protein